VPDPPKRPGTIEHKVFKDVIDYFDEKDVFVFNDTKVFPARLYGNVERLIPAVIYI